MPPSPSWNVCSGTLGGRAPPGRMPARQAGRAQRDVGTATRGGDPQIRRRCGLPHPPVRPVLPGRVRGGLVAAAVLDELEGVPPRRQLRLLRLVALRRLPRALLPAPHRADGRQPAFFARDLAGQRWAAAGDRADRGRRQPGGAHLVQVRRVDRRRGQRGLGRDAPAGRRDPAHRRVVLRLPGHQLRRRHLPPEAAAGGAARLRHLPVVLPPLGGRPDRAGGEFVPQLERPADPRQIDSARAFRLIMFGLAKKVIIAEQLANWIVKPVFNNPTQYARWTTWSASGHMPSRSTPISPATPTSPSASRCSSASSSRRTSTRRTSPPPCRTSGAAGT